MSAATTASDAAQAATLRRRPIARQVGWQGQDGEEDIDPVSTRMGPKLDSEDLVEIADCFLLFDLVSLDTCKDVFEQVANGRFNAADPAAATSAVTTLSRVASVTEQLRNIQSGQLFFHQDVLKNRFLIEYTGKSLSLLSQLMGHEETDADLRQTYIATFTRMLDSITSVSDHLLNATRKGAIDTETRAAIRRRWIRIREMCEWMEQRSFLESDRVVPAWSDIASRIGHAVPDSGLKITSSVPAVTPGGLNTILWATFVSNVVLTIPFLWKAYQYSTHMPGTREDADFWFLVQSCASQLIGLILSGMGLWRQSPATIWSWLPPTIVAGVCNVIAMPLYLVAPTEWSSFAVVVAGGVQAFWCYSWR